jgi:pimeloyl-ACP methyl ester carboxylesterase
LDGDADAPREAALIARALVGFVLALTTGCFPAAPVPMRALERPAAATHARTLIVFLPGRGDDAVTFDKQGFADAAHAAHLDADLLFADATLGYYLDESVIRRLDEDVIAPARARGYERIWLVGISLGGLGAIGYAREHPGVVDGLLLLAPYLGDDTSIAAIERAGGLASWEAPPSRGGFEGVADDAWLWLRETTRSGGPPAIWLGYGTSDRLRRSHALLAAALPSGHVLTADGGHAWRAWRALWSSFLASGALAPPPPR